MNLYEAYNHILTSEKLRCCFTNSIDDYRIETIFEEYNSSNFIKEVLFFNLGGRMLPWKDMGKSLKVFESRAHHTVSLFLLGILLFDELNLDINKVPSYDADRFKTFIYYWSKICLYHDIGYIYEYKSTKNRCFLRKMSTLDKFINNYNIKYNITDINESKELIKQYYYYRTQKHKTMDHGIVGGIILYDKALKQISGHRQIYESCKKGLGYFGDFRKIDSCAEMRMEYISMSIIKHNMWFAENEEDKKTYRRLNLDELIPLENNVHRYQLSNDVILFILCLTDSIEPVKRFEKEHSNCNIQELCELLKNIYISCNNQIITLTIINSKFAKKYCQSIKSLESWLEIETEMVCENKIQIKII